VGSAGSDHHPARVDRRTAWVAVAALCLATGSASPPEESAGGTAGSCWPGTAGTDPALCPPNDPTFRKRWEFRSDIPREIDRSRMHPAEIGLGSVGFSLDRAWQLTTGRDDVLIAVLDSGIRWTQPDLLEKLHLNGGELPLPEGSTEHDSNGDGILTVSDYAHDSRVGDRNGNGVLDPGDLIRAFSDCRDDDGNGYPDDISGYDFFSGDHCGFVGGDNDPDDETDFGHGSGIAATAAAQTNNGLGNAGVCPRCRILPVRVGDSFVVDANQFALGVVFATRAGASVIASALGSYNNTPAAQEAIDFAYDRGVTIVASAADEFSYHHNYPSVHNHTLFVNAVRHNHVSDYRKASTFWGLNPCTNFGARVWVTVPAVTCSSGATSRLAGVAGLIQSAAQDVGLGPLHAEELFQLVRATADDLDNSSPDWGEMMYPARAGFDQFTGYGRVNARAAVEAVRRGDIPPVVDLENPRWFAIVSPAETPTVAIHGIVRLPRAAKAEFELAYALGVEPRESDYAIVARGEVVGQTSGPLGLLDFTRLPRPVGPPPVDRETRDRFSVTLRLRATDDRGRVGEARRSFFVVDDPSWKRPFPIDLGSSGEAPPVLVDVDGDGRDEIVLPTADGLVRILSFGPDGLRTIAAALDERRSLPGVARDIGVVRETVVRGAAVGDLGGGGTPAIVVASREGKVYAFAPNGERLGGFPVAISSDSSQRASPSAPVEVGILSQPVLADLDGRAGLEIVVAALDGRVHAWRKDGSPLPGFPVALRGSGGAADRLDKSVSTPAVGDIDGDGRPEIVVGSNALSGGTAAVYALRAAGLLHPDGPFVSGWAPFRLQALRPDLLPTLSSGMHMTPGLVDVDGDGDREVVLYAVTGTSVLLVDQTHGGPQVLARFSLAPGSASDLRGTSFLGGTGSPLLADTDGDGRTELYASLLPFRMLTLRSKPGVPLDVPLALGGWTIGPISELGSTVPMLATFPRRMEDLMIWSRPAAADVDGDGKAEVLMGSGGYLLHAFVSGGGEAAGFPKFTGGWMFSAPAVGDLEGDGQSELVAVTREGYLFAWDLGPKAEAGSPAVTGP